MQIQGKQELLGKRSLGFSVIPLVQLYPATIIVARGWETVQKCGISVDVIAEQMP